MDAGIIRPLPSGNRSIPGPPANSLRSWPARWAPSLSWPAWRSALLFVIAFSVAFGYGSLLRSVTAFWLPDSILLCALLWSPRDTWWFYLLAALPMRFIFVLPPGAPVWLLIACYANDSIKALLSATLIQRFIGRKLRFDTLRQFLDYSLIAVAGVPLLSATAGGVSRYFSGADFFPAFCAWFLSDVLAALVFTPMILCFLAMNWRQVLALPRKHHWEAACLIAGVSVSGYLAFISNAQDSLFLLYLPMTFLLWAATRFGPFGAACSLSVISAFAAFGIFLGRVPFDDVPLSSAVLSFQLFMIVIAFPLLALATAIKEQQAGAATLRASEERLHQLSARLIDSQERERKLIGQHLHEDVAQRVAALTIELSSLAQSSETSEKLAAESFRLRQHAAEIMNDISRLSRQLRPPSLESVGLPAALRTLCDQLNDPSGTNVVYTQFGDAPALPWDVAVSLYRVAQESVDNALTHSRAICISVYLFCEDGAPELRISDNGIGFEPGSSAAQGMGLAGMAERMRSVGGKLLIHTSPGRGTEVVAFAPALAHAVHA